MNSTKKRFHNHNAWVYTSDDEIALRSYDTKVASIRFSLRKQSLVIVLTQYWDYSSSTIRQVSRFLNEHAKLFNNQTFSVNTIRSMIKNGSIKVEQGAFNEYAR